MPKKFKGPNSKAAEANERKTAAKRAEQEKKQKEIEDAKWVDNDKHVLAKEAKRKEEEEKKQKAIQRRNESRELEQKERADLTKQYGNKGQQKMTKFQIEREREREAVTRARAEEKKEEIEPPLEENINQIIRDQKLEKAIKGEVDESIEARSVEEALGQMGTPEADRNPEKRMKAAYLAYEEANLPILRRENPTLKLSQLKEMLWKQWQKSPENPLNQ